VKKLDGRLAVITGVDLAADGGPAHVSPGKFGEPT
jgi:hypothetical protein